VDEPANPSCEPLSVFGKGQSVNAAVVLGTGSTHETPRAEVLNIGGEATWTANDPSCELLL